jgi:thioredoxin 1
MDNFDRLINSSIPTLVDFFAIWCGPCKTMNPLIEEVKKDIGSEANIIKIDVDKNRSTASKYGVRSVPTLILFKEGSPIWRQSGVPPKNLIIETIKGNLN